MIQPTAAPPYERIIIEGWATSWKAAGIVCPASNSANQTGVVPAMFMAPTVSQAVLVGLLSMMAATIVGIMPTKRMIVVGRKTTAVTSTMKNANRTEKGV